MDAEPHKFKKPGGGRGRPSPQALCAECGIIWTDHPKVEAVKSIAATPKRAPAARLRMPPRPRRPQPVDDIQSEEDASDVEEVGVAAPKNILSPEEQARLDERRERIWEHMKNWWIEKEMKKDPLGRDRHHWEAQFEAECDDDW